MMIIHQVKAGDTIAKLSLKYGIRPIDLIYENKAIYNETDYIQPGETLKIPDKKTSNIRPSKYTCYAEYGPTDLDEDIKRWQEEYRELVKIDEIGKSVMGKPIYVCKIGTGKKEVFYSGGWHANEWLTTKLLVSFIEECLENLKNQNDLLGYSLGDIFSKITLYVVPLVNPDGVELVQQGIYETHPYVDLVKKINKWTNRFEHWSSNIRGVDLNHQWPAGWKVEADESPQIPWPRHYSGEAPLTEPEARAVYELTIKQNFAYVLAFHSQGQVIYWGYRNLEPIESKDMVTKLSLVSSYVPVRTADSDGGYKDWFIQETRRAGFTIEVGVGTNPLPFSSFSEIWSNNIMLCLEGLTL